MKIADKRKKTRFYEKKAFSAGGGAGKAKGAIIDACGDFGGLSCCRRFATLSSHAAGLLFLTRRREGFVLSADSADCRRLWRPVLPLTRQFTPPVFC
jgi:hypothetical protein